MNLRWICLSFVNLSAAVVGPYWQDDGKAEANRWRLIYQLATSFVMVSKLWPTVVVLSSLLSANAFPASSYLHSMGAQGINLLKLRYGQSNTLSSSNQDPTQISFRLKEAEFPPYYFQQPLDHFTNDSQTFGQRYWFSTRHYTPGTGGPVIVLEGGETSGEERLPFLDTG